MNWWGLARQEETSRDPTRRKRNESKQSEERRIGKREEREVEMR